MSPLIRSFPAIGALLVAATTPALAQTTFPEVEPNSIKAQANLVSCMIAGDMITGTSTGGVTAANNSNLDSVDYFRVKTCALPLGVYRHDLARTTATPGHTGSVRGLSQTGTVGVGGTPVAGSDVAIQTFNAALQLQSWYGFGKGEEIHYRATGTAATTSSYTDTLTTATVTPAVIGPFLQGSITITTEAQGHTNDTDFWVYDSGLNAIAGSGNDDTFPANGGLEGTLTRTYAPGTYYLAM